MFKKISLTFIVTVSSIIMVNGWGAWGHKHIGRGAVLALPAEMGIFYYNHVDFITEGSVVPDLRRGVLNDKAESPRHFIDVEDFKVDSVKALPNTWKELGAKYDSAFLQKSGTLPWHIQTLMDKLTAAFKKRSRSEIVFISAELSHYLGDAHVPLHATTNYDGQLSDQKGIHSLWESQIPELFGNAYNFSPAPVKYIDNINDEIFNIIDESHRLAEITLAVEHILKNKTPKDKIFEAKAPGDTGKTLPKRTIEYARSYQDALNGMVEKQMKSSITDVSSFWYTAWVNAGKPELTSLDDAHLTEQNRKNYNRELKAFKNGRINNLDVVKED